MAFDWSSLCSKSDTFYNTLPLLNENGSLEDDYSFKFSTSPANSKYSFTSSFVNGKRGLVQVKGSEVYTNYYNTKLGFNINNAPGVSLTARLTDDLVPLKGSSVGLSLTSEEREERANLDFNYENSSVNTNVSLSVPLPHRIFNLKTENQEDEKYNKTVRGSVVYRVDQNKDYFVGLDGTYKLPNEGETPKYDVRTVFARKNANFEGGVYYNRVQDKERNTKCGTYVTSETDDLTVSSNFFIQTNTNQVTLDNFVSFPGANGNRYLFGVQVAPKTSVSFGVQKAIDTNTRVTFAYAYLISKEENIKRSGLRVGIELSN